MNKQLILLSALLVFFYGCDWICGKQDCPESKVCENNCDKNRVLNDSDRFYLTFSLKESRKDSTQTIFVEHPYNSPSKNIFAIGCSYSDSKYENGEYTDVILKNFKMKAIVGNCMEIYNVKDTVEDNQLFIDVYVRPSDDPNVWTKPLKIKSLRADEVFEVRAKHEGHHSIYTRICTNFIAQ